MSAIVRKFQWRLCSEMTLTIFSDSSILKRSLVVTGSNECYWSNNISETLHDSDIGNAEY